VLSLLRFLSLLCSLCCLCYSRDGVVVLLSDFIPFSISFLLTLRSLTSMACWRMLNNKSSGC
jgi:hypothetical protein